MLLKIFKAGAPVLREPARRVTRQRLASPEMQQLIDLMIDTLGDYPGVGLAAPQVGEPWQLVIIEDKPEYLKRVPKRILQAQGREPVPLTVLVNPRLEILDDTPLRYFEGCLSVDGYRAIVPRARRVRVRAWDRHGARLRLEADDWLARILQHEIDHLSGSLYVDRMLSHTFFTEAVVAKDWVKASEARLRRLSDESQAESP
jgi:peptide deformylase